MNGYTKLFGSIIASTIWREDNETRIVWITMLAMADQRGEVSASLPGLSDFARVSIPDTERALAKLLAPDPYSRTKDHDGRRIQEIDGGWLILNHAKYRQALSKDDRREYMKQYMRNRKETARQTSKLAVNTFNSNLTLLAQADPEAEAKEDGKTPEVIYAAYPRKVSRPKAIAAITKALKTTPFDKLLAATQAFAKAWSGATADDFQFCKHPATWFNQECYNDDPTTWKRSQPTAPQRYQSPANKLFQGTCL
jgi:hypothetical protein